MSNSSAERNLYMFVASDFGLYVFKRDDNGWTQVRGGLENEHVTSVTARFGAILAGTRAGVQRSVDLGQSWWPLMSGLNEPYVRWVTYHPDGSGRAFAGTEPAAIFVLRQDEETWRECAEVARLRDANEWSLPYSPQAGCVRGFAFHGSRGYAAVEQGGLLVSDDRGASWQLAGGSEGKPQEPQQETQIHPDVHAVGVHPSSPNTVVAPTGGGLYVSSDGGDHWQRRHDCYCRAVWVDPLRADHMILGSAESVDRDGRIEETIDGGQTWQLRMAGLPAVWPEHMVERFHQAGDELLAVLSNGELIAAPLDTLAWHTVVPGVQEVNAVMTLEA